MATKIRRAEKPTRQDMWLAATSEAFAEVDLIGKAHPTYFGPVYRIGLNTWIYYKDEPLEVVHVLGKWFKQRYAK